MPDPMSRAYNPEFGAHLQHGHIFGQHIAVHAPQPFFFGVIDDSPHQQPTIEPPFAPIGTLAHNYFCAAAAGARRPVPSLINNRRMFQARAQWQER